VHARPHQSHLINEAVFRPPRALGVIVGSGLTLWALFLALALVNAAVDARVEFKTFLAWLSMGGLLVLAAMFANWTYSVGTLSYTVRDNALTVRWGFHSTRVPIESIQRMVPGRTLDVAHIRGVSWWGCHLGTAEVSRFGTTAFFSTHTAPDELLYVVTSAGAFALTVEDHATFAEEIQSRAGLGPVIDIPHETFVSGIGAWPLLHDRVAIGAAVFAAMATAVLGGYVFSQYPALPNVIELNFPDFGGVVRVGDKSELLRIAYVGWAIAAANAALGAVIHAYERAAGVWLLASAGMIQLVLLGAAVAAFQQA
jgi:energy-coupling factor transporter transmembrane protein EcfT